MLGFIVNLFIFFSHSVVILPKGDIIIITLYSVSISVLKQNYVL